MEDEGEEEEDSVEDEDSSENQVDREERARQREMMKEMRARREAERLVESKFREEVNQQRANIKVKRERKLDLVQVVWSETNTLFREPQPRRRDGKEAGKVRRRRQRSRSVLSEVRGRNPPPRPGSRHRNSLSRTATMCTNLLKITNPPQPERSSPMH